MADRDPAAMAEFLKKKQGDDEGKSDGPPAEGGEKSVKCPECGAMIKIKD